MAPSKNQTAFLYSHSRLSSKTKGSRGSRHGTRFARTNNVKEVVIRDRMMLAQEGMFVIIAIVNVKTGKVIKSPDIISRGFVYLKESQDLLRQTRMMAKHKIEEVTNRMHPINFDYVKNLLRDEIGKYLFQKTHHRPLVLPVLIEV